MKHLNLLGYEELTALLACFIFFLVFFTIKHLIERLHANKVRHKRRNKIESIFTWRDLWKILCYSATYSIGGWLSALYVLS